MVLCACGCGKKLSNRAIRSKSKFINRNHYAKYREKMRAENGYYKRLKPKSNPSDRKILYELGDKFCKDYDNDNIKCVMCIENNLEKPEKCNKEK